MSGLVIVSLGLIDLPVHLAAYRERGVPRRFPAARVPARALPASQLTVLAAGVVAGTAPLMVLASEPAVLVVAGAAVSALAVLLLRRRT